MKFSEKLKQAMQQLGINQAQVVGLTGKSKGSISMYLNDKTTPSEQVQSDIAVSLGHDPSGIDMTRDIQERLQMFGADVYVKRVALTMNQIGTYNPPPNPAKITDSRASKYIDEYGNESWELDALEPQVITDLITNEVTALRNDEIYRSVCDSEERGKDELKMIERNYDKAVAFLESEE